jgi:rhodanese-related sulfurtransferase
MNPSNSEERTMKTAHDLVAAAKTQIREITPAEAEQAISEADIVIDVREPEEYHQGHIPGSVNIPRGLLEFRVSSTPELEPRDLAIVLYCKSNGRGALAAKTLKDMGYINVETIAGGIDAWIAEHKPVATPQPLNYD